MIINDINHQTNKHDLNHQTNKHDINHQTNKHDLNHIDEHTKNDINEKHIKRIKSKERGPIDTKIAVIGNVDSGKSTIIGLLTSGILDDGRGSARSRIFRFDHERTNGRTSSASHHIMGFDALLNPIQFPVPLLASAKQKTRAWQSVIQESKKIITFIDLAGHEKYLKTTITGLTGFFPDYAMIMVGSNMGVSKMTKEHISVALALKVPIFVVFTKVDMCPEDVLRHNLKELFKFLKSSFCKRLPKIIKKKKDVSFIFESDPKLQRICPIFLISAVTGINLDKLYTYLSQLQPTIDFNSLFNKSFSCTKNTNTQTNTPTNTSKTSHIPFIATKKQNSIPLNPSTTKTLDSLQHSLFEIDETFIVRGVGIVLSGTVTSGKLLLNRIMHLGPFSDGNFKQIAIRSIHAKRLPVEDAITGESCSVSIRHKANVKIERSHIRKGMILVDEYHIPVPTREFSAQVLVLHHPTTIRCNYEPVLHCGNIRQTVIIKKMSEDNLRSGDGALIHFRFKCRPEFLYKGRTMILREGNTKCLGKIVGILC